MLGTYFKIAVRSLLKNRFFSFVNIIGLAVSMSACLLIILMIADQKKYDRFHLQKDQIYRILSKRANNNLWNGTSPFPLRNEFINTYPGIHKVTTLSSFVGGDLRYGEKVITQAGIYADSSFFGVFDFPLLEGSENTSLKEPYSILLKKNIADKLFGDADPVGMIISFKDRKLDVLGLELEQEEKDLGEFKVTGIIGNEGYKSHIKFDFLVSMSTMESLQNNETYSYPFDDWKNIWEFYHYVLLRNDKDEEYLNGILQNIATLKYADIPENQKAVFEAQPLSEITPGKFINNPISFRLPLEAFYFLSLLALLVVFSACFNYTNLSVAKALSRAKEVGLRKINGARRYQIFLQFISESVIITLVALVISIILLQVLKSGFSGFWINQFVGIEMNENVKIFGIFILFSILLGIIAGLIPALYLSSFSPLKVMVKDFRRTGIERGMFIFKKPFIGKSLVVIQFVFSFILITTTIILFAQVKHLAVAEYGFERENLVNVKLQGNDYETLANEFSSNSNVIRISATNIIPAMGIMNGADYKNLSEPWDSTLAAYYTVDQNYLANFGLSLVAGQNFPDNIADDHEQYVIINEKAVTKLGFENPNEAIGKFIARREKPEESVEVIGVVKDYYFDLFMEDVQPLVLRYKPDEFRYANVKISGNDIPGTVAFLDKKWKMLDPDHVFNYKFFDEQLAKTNAIFKDVIAVIGFISFLAISISCLGLLGMATYSAESKRKEVGIRKVMGASVKGLVFHLSKGFLIMLAIAITIALPATFFINNFWLQEFAYRINLGPDIFISGIIIIIFLGLLTIGSQTIRASLSNPAKILREE